MDCRRRTEWLRYQVSDIQNPNQDSVAVSHLTIEEREVISRMRFQGALQKDIAKELNRSEGTISRELSRNKGAREDYNSRIAQGRAEKRRQCRPLKRKMESVELLKRVGAKLEENWTPEQISGRLLAESGEAVVSHQTIYAYLNCLKRDHPHRHAMRRRGRRYRPRNEGGRRSTIPNRVSISRRPQVVALRKRFGDWELDLVVGTQHSGFLVTAVDRKSGFTKIRKIVNKRTATVMRAIISMFKDVPAEQLRTFTFDNGTEFTGHEVLSKQLGVKVYFADPYNSGQRGTNENTNGLIRQYAPKKLDFRYLSVGDVNNIAAKLNNRPRKRLRYRTPNEILFDRGKIAFQF